MACQVIRSTHGESLRKGPWLEEEDEQLVTFVTMFGDRKWDSIATVSGLKRSGKSCRLRWLNYLRPNLKRGHISPEEEQIIIQLHQLWGNKWAKIARRLPGRTDNEIKNYWRSHLRKKLQAQEGNFPCKVNNTKQENILYQEGEITSSWNSSMEEEYKANKDGTNTETTTTRISSLEQYELSNLACLNSPYETRIYDWISEMSDEQNGVRIKRDCGDFGDEDGGDGSLLDFFGSIWDMN